MLTAEREQVQHALVNWARWQAGRASGGIGWSPINILAREAGRSAQADYIPIGVVEAERVDGLMRQLRERDDRSWSMLTLRYVGPRAGRGLRPMSEGEIARLCECGVETVRRWIRDAEHAMWDLMRTRSASRPGTVGAALSP